MGKKVNVITGERSMSNGRHRYNEKEKDSRETQQQELMPNIEGFTEGTILSKLDSDFVEEDNGKLFDDLKKSASKTSTDDNTDTASSLSTQSTVSEPETSKPRQDQISAQDSKEGETYRRQQKEISHKTQTSVAKSSTPTDFRANLKKTGVNLRNLDKKGKVEKFDFRSQLKKTGLSTSYETSGLRRRDSPKVDFRSALQQTTGQRYGSNYLDVNVTADIHTSSKGKQYLEEIKKSVSSKSKADENKDEEKNEDKEEKKERKCRVSSADLLGLVNQPREDVTADLALRVGRKTETLKSPTSQTFNLQKQLVNKEADEDFQAQMARRKHKVNTPQLKPSDITEKKSRGGKAETSDFRKVLRKASVTSHTSQVFKKQDRGDATTDISSIAPALVVKKGSYSEQSTIPCDTVDTGKSQSGNAIAGYENSSGDSVVGGKETENISGHFPSKISQDIGRAKEANPTKTDGKKSFGKSNIDAMFEKRRRERVMAKKKEAAEKKQGRAAFKAKLEAQNPKPANSGGRSFQTGSKITRAMIEWCRRKTDGYEGVDIQNFTTSWTNGLAMCALLHRFVPEKIDYGSLNPKDRRGNWKLAFDVAGECGVEPLLELEDVMACSVPEPKSLMTYVHFIYQFFCEAPKEKRPPPGFDDDEEEDDDD